MKIQVKQPEIISALKQYVSSQGFSLDGKEVTVTFTAGRKESGLSADIVINDLLPLPDLSDTVKPTLMVVQAPKAEEPAPEAEQAPQPAAETPTKSLFG